MLIETLLDKLSDGLDNKYTPTKTQVYNIVTFIEGCRLDPTHLNRVLDLQTKIANLAPLEFELESLIDFASLSCATVRPEDKSHHPNVLADAIWNQCKLLCYSKKVNNFEILPLI